eukprot:1204722-Alexandrium_andersonii.AAC.1
MTTLASTVELLTTLPPTCGFNVRHLPTSGRPRQSRGKRSPHACPGAFPITALALKPASIRI